MKRNAKIVFVSLIFSISLFIDSSAFCETEYTEPSEQPGSLFSSKNIIFSGIIEIEANYEDYDSQTEDNSSSNISLATVELGIDAQINNVVSGRVLFLYEEEDDAEIEIDEGFITIDSPSDISYFLMVGRQYIPFGNYETVFISDPVTLELGETRKTVIMGGYENDWLHFSVGFFNGDVDEEGEEDDHVINYVMSANALLSNEALGDIRIGISHINNIAESDTLAEEIITPEETIKNRVPGYACYLSGSYKKLGYGVEYVWAGDDFEAGELSFDNGETCHPSAFNSEISFSMTENICLGIRYGFTNDGGEVLAERIYGGIVNYVLFENTFLGFEVQSLEFETDEDVLAMAAQLAICF